MSEHQSTGGTHGAEARIREYLRSRFRGYRDDMSIEESLEHVVDSLGLFELVEFLEGTFEFRIPNSEFRPSRFQTIGRILEVLEGSPRGRDR